MINMQKKQFLQTLGQNFSAQGYRQISPICFEKKVCRDMSYRILVIFAGKAIIEATPLFGFNFPEVEIFLQSKSEEIGLPKENKSKFPTIFKQIDKYIHGNSSNIFPKDISRFRDDEFSDIIVMARDIECLVPNKIEMCEYININHDFPVGHHAYRIPVFLGMNKYFLAKKEYEVYVESLDFIDNYRSNLEKLFRDEL